MNHSHTSTSSTTSRSNVDWSESISNAQPVAVAGPEAGVPVPGVGAVARGGGATAPGVEVAGPEAPAEDPGPAAMPQRCRHTGS